MRLFANIISCLFHPLLMVTYGILLALTFTYLAIYPPMMKAWLATGAFLSTAIIPGAFILLMIKNGAAVDMELCCLSGLSRSCWGLASRSSSRW